MGNATIRRNLSKLWHVVTGLIHGFTWKLPVDSVILKKFTEETDVPDFQKMVHYLFVPVGSLGYSCLYD